MVIALPDNASGLKSGIRMSASKIAALNVKVAIIHLRLRV
jgi:hypothetical protein